MITLTAERITTISDVIADEIKATRKRAGLTRGEFAAAAWEKGAPESFSAAVVGYIETGRPDKEGRRRREVTVDELRFIAAAAGTTPLGLLGEHAALLGGDEPPECPRCAAETGALERQVRADIAQLGDLADTEPGLAELAYALAAGIDRGADENPIPPLAKELRATLKTLTDAVAVRTAPDDDDEFGDLGDPE
ncbi:hypothetical protein [Amycolatopsis sp. NPDC102389]|uniref:hypothetical protein n=1 Tax=Amycolatopsis sp. NPDC102389 TaxID=3363941 RepID=UPI003829C8AE